MIEMPKEIKMWNVDQLIPYERNSRKHSSEQIERIARSIEEFGFTNPILVDGTNGIIAGHGRLMAARKLGLSEVPVIQLDHLTEEQKRAYIIADNRLAELSEWDDDILKSELFELQEFGFDLELTGFDDSFLIPVNEPVKGKDYTGSKEINEDDFKEFDHVCPKCGFEFDDKD